MVQQLWSRRLVLFFVASVLTSQSFMDLASTLMVLWGGWLLWSDWREQKTVRWKSGFEWFFLGWFLWIGLSYAMNYKPDLPWEAGLYEFRWMLEFIFYLIVIRRAEFDLKSFKPFFVICLFVAIYSLLAYFARWNFLTEGWHERASNLVELDWRAGGFFENPMPWAHTVGLFSCVVFAFVVNQLLKNRRPSINLPFLTSLTLFAATLVTMTRGVWLGLLIGVPVMIRRASFALAWGSFLSLIILGLLTTVFSEGIRDRVVTTFTGGVRYEGQRAVLWMANIHIVKDSPIWGWGYSENSRRLRQVYKALHVPKNQLVSHAHNQYLHFLAGTGVVGLLFYLVFLLILGVRLFRAARPNPSSDPFLKTLSLGVYGALICFIINGLTEANFSIAKNRFAFLLLMALGLWAAEELNRIAHKQDQPEASPAANSSAT